MGYDQGQTLKAIREAESYPGPALVICYCPCLEHGIKAGMSCTQNEMKKAVECGYWHLYRYDPRRIAEGKNPFQLDSPEPDSAKMMDYLEGENRYASLQINFPDRAERLYKKTIQDAKDPLCQVSEDGGGQLRALQSEPSAFLRRHRLLGCGAAAEIVPRGGNRP